MSDVTFSIVTRISNWGYWDEINGKSVTGGKHLIKWPDGSITEEDVKVHKGTMRISDMGHSDSVRNDYAYVVVNVRGVNAEVRIAGLEAHRIDPEPKTPYEEFASKLSNPPTTA